MVRKQRNKTATADKAATKPCVLIATGASGGHIIPALAIADELKAAGYNVVFTGYGGGFNHLVEEQGYVYERLTAYPWNVRNPLKKLKAVFGLLRAMTQAMRLMQRHHPNVLLGMGGYATVAAVMAGRVSGVPIAVHEQNTLPGRANRLLAKWVDMLLISFEQSRKHFPKVKPENIHLTGNPVRQRVLKIARQKRQDEGFQLCIMGGSQGAAILSDVVPKAVDELTDAQKQSLRIVQQARPEHVAALKLTYENMGVQAHVAHYFSDMPEHIRQSHVFIGRAGAGTVAECAVLGRAAIYVPLRLADGHQIENARAMVAGGGAFMLEEKDFSPNNLAQLVRTLMDDEKQRRTVEKAALKLARPQAAAEAAALVQKLAEEDVMHMAHVRHTTTEGSARENH